MLALKLFGIQKNSPPKFREKKHEEVLGINYDIIKYTPKNPIL